MFKKNLEFFKLTNKELFNHIVRFDKKINNSFLPQKNINQIKTIHFEEFNNEKLDKLTKKVFYNLLALFKNIDFKNNDTKSQKLIVLGCDSLIPIDYDIIFIYENSFEKFYNLLSIVEFYKIRKLYICFKKDKLLHELDKFYKDNFFLNYTIDYINNLDKNIFKTIYLSLFNNDSLSFPYTKYINDFKHIKKNKNYPYIDFNYSSFKDKKVLILAPGPSLEKYIKEVKKNKNNFILISYINSLSVLEKYNLYPDFLVISDSSKLLKKFLEIKNKKYFNIPLLSDVAVYPKILKKFRKVFIFDFKKENFLANTVSEIAYQLSIKLKAKEIYLLGIDLAFGKNFNIYSSGYKNLNEYKSLDNEFIKIKGNKNDFVYTDLFFKNILDIFKIINKNNNVKCFNFGNGAKIYGCEAIRFRDFKKEDKNITIKTNNYSLNFDFEIDFNYAEVYTKEDFLDYTKYLISSLLNINQNSYEKKLFVKIIYNYLNITLNFIYFFINSNAKINYNSLTKELFNQILKILNFIN